MQLNFTDMRDTNPQLTAEPQWDRPATRDLAMRVSADCPSNETTLPWFSHVAPFSWLIQHDVDEGRTIPNLFRNLHPVWAGPCRVGRRGTAKCR